MVDWLTPAEVSTWGKIDAQADDPDLVAATDAARSYVERVRPEYLGEPTGEPPAATYTPDADVKLGGLMLAARLYHRRGTPLGVAGFSDFGGPALLRNDPDISRLLRIGPYAPFTFGAPTPPVVEEA